MRKRKNIKKIKRENKSQKCDISPLCGGAPCEPISTKFGVFVGLTNIIIYAKNGLKIFSGFFRATGGKTHVSYRKPTAYITLPCATALACDNLTAVYPGISILTYKKNNSDFNTIVHAR